MQYVVREIEAESIHFHSLPASLGNSNSSGRRKTRSEVMWLPFFAQVSDECYLFEDALDSGSSSLTPW